MNTENKALERERARCPLRPSITLFVASARDTAAPSTEAGEPK